MGQGELRLQALRKQLKRITAQCDALKAELAEGKRRDRTAELYKKKVIVLFLSLKCKLVICQETCSSTDSCLMSHITAIL